MNEELAVLGRLFTEITNRSKGGFFVIRETHFHGTRHGFTMGRRHWYAKACRPDGTLVAVKAASRIAACEQLLALLRNP